MIRPRRLSFLLICLILGGRWPSHSEIVDRIVAVVNNQIITLSDVEEEAKFEEIGISGEDAASDHAAGKEVQFEITQRLIDQALIRQQLEQFPGIEVSSEEVEKQLTQIREQFGSEEQWKRTLETQHIDPVALKSRVEWQLQVVKFIDYRFRQFVVVDPKEIEDYYNNHLISELAKRGVTLRPALAEAEERIREILTEEKVDVEIENWLKSLRESASIAIFN